MTMDVDTLPPHMRPEVDHDTDIETMKMEESLASEDEFEEAQIIGDTSSREFKAVDLIIEEGHYV